MANDNTGEVETKGPHKASYVFCVPVGSTFTVTRGNVKSLVTRTPTAFVVENQAAA